MDETFIGGKLKNMHKSRRVAMQKAHDEQLDPASRYPGKTAVQGMLDRELRQVRATVVPNVRRETLQAQVLKNVRYGSRVYTDDAVTYDRLNWRYVHDVVNHADAYVKDRVHTNGLENFWSLLKRTLKGTYVAVEPFHLDRYLDEQAFRFNNRATKDNPLTDSDRLSQHSHKSQESVSLTKNSQARQAKRRLSNPYRKRRGRKPKIAV